jgi:exodeoxyribonuclease VII small subunit
MRENKALTFEQACQELDQVVQKLEAGDLSLEQSLVLFERGMTLAKLCETKLDEAELKVSQLSSVSSDGAVLTPFRGEA